MKKLIPAICMTLIAAVMLASSTFAWFSMNTSVTADGMQVAAKSDNTYLLISSDKKTAAEIQDQNKITVDLAVGSSEAKVYPCAPAISDTEVGYLTTSGKTVGGATITTAGVKVESMATASAFTNWYTATAETSGASGMKDGTARQLTDFTGYVIRRTVYLTVAKGANAANNLTVTPTITGTGKDLTAAHVIVATSDGGFENLTNTNNGTKVEIKGSNTALTELTVLTVEIYIYIDGNNTNIFTNNKADLTGVTIDLAFNVKAVTA